MSIHAYHYHATYQTTPGQIENIDGIARLYGKVKDMSDYAYLKDLIDSEHSDILVINSLSYLGEFDEQ